MKINKFGFFLSLLSFLCVATVSTGFDLYAHAVIYYIFDYPITSSYVLFEDIAMPRYLLLSYILEITRRLGIPTGVTVSFLIIYPVYNIAKHISSRTRAQVLSSSQVIIVLSIITLSLFYSGLSLVLLWLMALLITQKKRFIIGALFHPLGLILGGLLSIVFRKYIKFYSLMLIIFVIFLYLLTIQGYFTSSIITNVRYYLPPKKDEAINILQHSYESKANEFYAMIIILLLTYFSKTKLKSLVAYIKGIYFSRKLIIIFCFLIVTIFNAYFISKDRHSLIIDTFSLNISDPIYYTWYDWGKRDLNQSAQTLYNKRYE